MILHCDFDRRRKHVCEEIQLCLTDAVGTCSLFSVHIYYFVCVCVFFNNRKAR